MMIATKIIILLAIIAVAASENIKHKSGVRGASSSWATDGGESSPAPLLARRAADCGVTFDTTESISDVVETLLDPNGSVIDVRNARASSHKCLSLFSNGHKMGQSVPTMEYLLPERGLVFGTGGEPENLFCRNDSNVKTAPTYVDDASCFLEFQFKCPPHRATTRDFSSGVSFKYDLFADRHLETADWRLDDAFSIALNGEDIAMNSEERDFTLAEAGGFTKLTMSSVGIPLLGDSDGWNTMKITIADGGDRAPGDSWVFLESGAFSCAATTSTAAE